MKKYEIVPMYDKYSNKFLYNYLFMIVKGKMVGVADSNGPMEFKTRLSAKIIAKEMINN